MSSSSDPDLIKVTEIFLVPSSFLVAALGTADTNFHRAAVSVVGLTISILWWVCSREASSEIKRSPSPNGVTTHPRRTWILSWLALIFVAGWLVSTIAHAWYWNRPLGT
ncbi:MAG: hypothetical protein ACKVP0_16160 [Pirellulaceae bacterium]